MNRQAETEPEVAPCSKEYRASHDSVEPDVRMHPCSSMETRAIGPRPEGAHRLRTGQERCQADLDRDGTGQADVLARVRNRALRLDYSPVRGSRRVAPQVSRVPIQGDRRRSDEPC
jgi:hypothetical protein